MKKFITMAFLAATVLSAAMTFSSCSNENNDNNGNDTPTTAVNPKTVFTGGLPKSVAGATILMNDKGQVISIKDGKDLVTFQYNVARTRSGASTPNVIMTIGQGKEKQVCNLFLDKDGFVKHCDETEYNPDGEEKETWDFTYNNDGQLLTMLRSEGGYEKTIVKYNSGNILETITTSAENPNTKHSYKIFYTSESVPSPIVNKGCLMQFDQTLGIDMDEMIYAYYAGLLGKATKNLPVKLVDNENYTENFTWTLNSSGYPISFKRADYDTYSFAW